MDCDNRMVHQIASLPGAMIQVDRAAIGVCTRLAALCFMPDSMGS